MMDRSDYQCQCSVPVISLTPGAKSGALPIHTLMPPFMTTCTLTFCWQTKTKKKKKKDCFNSVNGWITIFETLLMSFLWIHFKPKKELEAMCSFSHCSPKNPCKLKTFTKAKKPQSSIVKLMYPPPWGG